MLQTLRGQMNVSQVVGVLENRFAGVEGLGASGPFGGAVRTAFDFGVGVGGGDGDWDAYYTCGNDRDSLFRG